VTAPTCGTTPKPINCYTTPVDSTRLTVIFNRQVVFRYPSIGWAIPMIRHTPVFRPIRCFRFTPQVLGVFPDQRTLTPCRERLGKVTLRPTRTFFGSPRIVWRFEADLPDGPASVGSSFGRPPEPGASRGGLLVVV
jgi:hypothetical protein